MGGVSMLLQTANIPKNETPEHYELKQIAKYMLWRFNYNIMASEAHGILNYEYAFENNIKLKHGYYDVLGLKLKWQNLDTSEIKITTMGIEAKASLSDFKNGFNISADYTYIISPKGILNIKDIPDEVGLIEVDLNSYSIEKYDVKKLKMTGIEIKRVARKIINSRKEALKVPQRREIDILRHIAYRATVDDVLRRPEILIT
jgi:hypothetical protein